MKTLWILSLSLSVLRQDETLARRAEAIRPTAAEARWREIPWVASVAEGREAAQKEDLPLFVWAADDDPLERC